MAASKTNEQSSICRLSMSNESPHLEPINHLATRELERDTAQDFSGHVHKQQKGTINLTDLC